MFEEQGRVASASPAQGLFDYNSHRCTQSGLRLPEDFAIANFSSDNEDMLLPYQNGGRAAFRFCKEIISMRKKLRWRRELLVEPYVLDQALSNLTSKDINIT